MSTPFRRPSAAVIAELRAFAERQLSPEEFEAYVSAPMGEFEREQMESLIDWFMRRYPTPAERLRYARNAYRRWQRHMPR